tara:strand:+ start:63488 stop:64183 length:696 start_codon:yes stop_codon:yes gene_type:complete
MRILGLIPARGGSKSVPGKNIKKLEGKPLLQYTVEVAEDVKNIAKLILSSDDDAIIEVAKSLNLEVPFKRPSDLAKDNTPTLPVIQHALRFFEAQNIYFDAVCLLQVTSPFKTSEFIDSAIKKFIDTKADALVSVQKIPEEYNPYWAFKPNKDGYIELASGEKDIIARRQDLPITYHRDGLIYITKTEVILNKNSLYGEKISYIESPKESAINIDTMLDWSRAIAYLQSKK